MTSMDMRRFIAESHAMESIALGNILQRVLPIGLPQMSRLVCWCSSPWCEVAISCTSGFDQSTVVRNDAQFVFLDGLIFDQAAHQEAWDRPERFHPVPLWRMWLSTVWLTWRGPQWALRFDTIRKVNEEFGQTCSPLPKMKSSSSGRAWFSSLFGSDSTSASMKS